ncbi:MAG: holo-ACP synthase [Acidimicrobiales bacterium]
MIRSIGLDAVEIDRMALALSRTPRIIERVFTEGERAYAERGNGTKRVERYAARFAAKEAVMKSLGVGLGAFKFHDVEVVRAPSGAPSVAVRGAAADLMVLREVTALHVSLTHTARTAFAFVIAEG